jgi:hypothetical protein
LEAQLPPIIHRSGPAFYGQHKESSGVLSSQNAVSVSS